MVLNKKASDGLLMERGTKQPVTEGGEGLGSGQGRVFWIRSQRTWPVGPLGPSLQARMMFHFMSQSCF